MKAYKLRITTREEQLPEMYFFEKRTVDMITDMIQEFRIECEIYLSEINVCTHEEAMS